MKMAARLPWRIGVQMIDSPESGPSRMAICDFDGVIADIAEHTKIAQERAKASVLQQAPVVAHFVEQYDTLLFIDDDERNRKTVEAIAAHLNNVTVSVKSCFEECFLSANLP
jgi:hypothetical protein